MFSDMTSTLKAEQLIAMCSYACLNAYKDTHALKQYTLNWFIFVCIVLLLKYTF